MPPSGQREGLARKIGDRNVGREAKAAREAFKLNVIRAIHATGSPWTIRGAARRLRESEASLRVARQCETSEWAGMPDRIERNAARNPRPETLPEGVSNVVFKMFVFSRYDCWPHCPSAGPTTNLPPSAASRSVENTGSESNRGRQHHTISPVDSTSAEN